MASEIARINDPLLNDTILAAAIKNDCGEQVLNLLNRSIES